MEAFLAPEGMRPDDFVGSLAEVARRWSVVSPAAGVLADAIREAEAVVVETSEVTPRILEAAERLRVVLKLGAVADNIDIAGCAARGIAVKTIERATTVNVAEHAVMLLLVLLRRFHLDARIHRPDVAGKGDPAVRQSSSTFNWRGVMGIRTVAGLNVGVVGMGDIGMAFSRRVRSLGANVAYWSRRSRVTVERELDARRLELPELAKWADAISIHAGAWPELHHVIDQDFLGRLGRHGLLVNTSRAALVDTAALAHALRRGELAGAAIDVFDTEPLAMSDPLAEVPDLIMTPHVGGGGRLALRADLAKTLAALA
jgi:lactate dehydrogenase-like 2-hydroxyacid dehydrogenase